MKNIPSIFGELVFNNEVMKERLPKEHYEALQRTMESGKHLELDIANIVANAMKDWAIEKGATHYTHWFQPLTGVTAEKHDSFISPCGNAGIIMDFSGKELVKGEPDASSFPSGGLRATFEARGYTAWDPSSYAFIKDDSLYIPTAFCSYSGEALDKKTPLLRSMQALDQESVRLLKILGYQDIKRVSSTVGAEQEYFLIDLDVYEKRQDLVNTGRTLFGAKPPKGQELDDHYFGVIKQRVSDYMKDVDETLWRFGICAKTKHNEVAPAQHELAPVYCSTNIASDQNQLTMQLLKSIARQHHMACLLHEKPFAGINGSGKHNNWSISTDTGVNLLDPGKTPQQNIRFLVFLMAVIKAVDEHQDLLRISVASAGNDHRLGANEAPPAVLSVFLGDDLQAVLDAIEKDEIYAGNQKTMMQIGASVLPHIPKDATDRNRTSPFAFTGNKFEFRMLGSENSIAGSNIILNTIVADAVSQFADTLEKSTDIEKDVLLLIKDTLKKHKRIIFNGNNYAEEWLAEAEKRGLLNLTTTVDALPYFKKQNNIDLFKKFKVLSETELHSRYEIMLENYINHINIEGLTMVEMVKKNILNSAFHYEKDVCDLVKAKAEIGIDYDLEKGLAVQTSDLVKKISINLQNLEQGLKKANEERDLLKKAQLEKTEVFDQMQKLRESVDKLETMLPTELWPYPSYFEMLYSVL